MNQPNLFLFCGKCFGVTASAVTYRNAESINHIMVTGSYRVDRNSTVLPLLEADIVLPMLLPYSGDMVLFTGPMLCHVLLCSLLKLSVPCPILCAPILCFLIQFH
jgi:hypothetical protein